MPLAVPVVSVSCGENHSLMLNEQGLVYAAGKGSSGALGNGHFKNSSQFICVLKGAQQISAGKDFSLALVGSKVYGWGSNGQGQLGLLNKKTVVLPKNLNVFSADQICAGDSHSLFLTSKGVYGCGSNSNY